MKRIPGTKVERIQGNRFGGYLVKFTGPERRDLAGEWFDDDTDFNLVNHPLQGKPALYHHAMDGSVRSVPVGVIDRVEYRAGEGIWAEARNDFAKHYKAYLESLPAPHDWKAEQLQIAEEYQGIINEMIDAGLLGWSSGALPGAVQTEKGHIKSWPIIEGSLTPSPAAPIDTTITALKSRFNALFRELDARETDEPAGAPETASAYQNEEPTVNKTEISKVVKAEVSDELLKLLRMVGEEIGKMELTDDEAMNMMAEDEVMATVEEEAMNMVAEEQAMNMTDTDEDKAEHDDEKGNYEDETMRVRRAARSAFARHQANVINRVVRAHHEAKARKQADIGKRVRGIERDLHMAPAASPKAQYGAGKSLKEKHQIKMGDNLKFAGVTASDMALAVQLVASELPPMARKKMDLGQYFSDDFVNHLGHKIADDYKRNTDRRVDDMQAIKSALPFKAGEIDASDITGQGEEWVGVYYSTTIWERARNETELYNKMLARGMMEQVIPQGDGSAFFPLEDNDPIVYTTQQANNIDATGRPEITAQITPFGTDRVQVTPGEQKLATSYTVTLEEDSLIRLAPQVNQQIANKMRENIEQSLINGDTATAANTNINLIDGTPVTGLERPYYMAFDGIRKHFLVTNTTQSRDAGASFDLADFRLTLALLDKTVRSRRDRLLWVMDFDTETAALAIPQIATKDVAGDNQNTVFVGFLPPIYRIEPYISGFLDLSGAAGSISATPANNTRGTLACIYAPYWGYARKRDVTIETGRHILSGTQVYVASIRHALVARGANAAAGSYNVAV